MRNLAAMTRCCYTVHTFPACCTRRAACGVWEAQAAALSLLLDAAGHCATGAMTLTSAEPGGILTELQRKASKPVAILTRMWDETTQKLADRTQGTPHVMVFRASLRVYAPATGLVLVQPLTTPPSLIATPSAEQIAGALSSTPVQFEDLCKLGSFKLVVVSDTLDSASANHAVARREGQRARESGAVHSTWWCMAHQLHLATSRAVSLQLQEPLASIYSGSLLMRMGALYWRMMSQLHQVVSSRLRVVFGPPPPSAAAVSKQLLLLAGMRSGELQHADALLAVLNGHWLKDPNLVHYCAGATCCPNREATVQRVVTSLARTVLARIPSVPMKARWTKAGAGGEKQEGCRQATLF